MTVGRTSDLPQDSCEGLIHREAEDVHLLDKYTRLRIYKDAAELK
jgi:hypothetical protein